MASENKTEREAWSGKWAFILAAAGSAVGLGNMWRFPYLDAKYGGGTFLFVYLILVFTLGVSLLLTDIALDRNAQSSVVKVFSRYGKKCSIIGVLALSVPFIIMPYYSIIGGWVAKYMAVYITAGPAALADGGDCFVDFITGGAEWLMMPIVALLTCLFDGWVMKPKTLVDEVRISSKFRLAGAYSVMIKYIAPVMVVVILVAYVAAQFGIISL